MEQCRKMRYCEREEDDGAKCSDGKYCRCRTNGTRRTLDGKITDSP